MRVLIVEEVGFVRHNLEQLLVRQDHAVVTARSCEHALDMLRTDQKIEVVIAPLLMSGFSGIDLFQEAHKIQRVDDSGKPFLEFILTMTEESSDDMKKKELVKQALDIGFVDVLVKPIDSAKLLFCLNQIEMSQANDTKATPAEEAGETTSAVSSAELLPENQIQMLQDLRNFLSQMQKEITTQLQHLDDTLETIRSQ